jgi:hypothetical protein
MFLVKKNPWRKKECEMVHFRAATTRSFVATVQGEVLAHFHAAAEKRHSSVWS